MALIYCNRSALYLYRSNCPMTLSRASLAGAWRQGATTFLERAAESSRGPARYLERPLHLLVPPNVKRKSGVGMRYHVATRGITTGSLRSLGDGGFVVSPDYVLYELSRELGLLEAIQLGYELCGTYSRDREGRCVFGSHDPYVTRRSLARLSSQLGGAYGSRRFARVVPFVLENSCSPAETAVAMLLCLPPRHGGFGLPQPRMNYRIDPGARRVSEVGKGYYLCDLYWPEARVAVEYDSDLFHTGSERIAADAKRRTDLLALGVTVLTLTRRQLYDERLLASFAKILARELGCQVRIRCEGFEQRHRVLRATVLGGGEGRVER